MMEIQRLTIREQVRLLPQTLWERVVESPFVLNSRGRVRILETLKGKIRAGDELTQTDLMPVAMMPPSWQRTIKLVLDSEAVIFQGNVVLEQSNNLLEKRRKL